MMTIRAFIQRHALPAYFVLAFAVAWGGILLAVGPGAVLRGDVSDVAPGIAIWGLMLLGSGGVGLLLAGVVDGGTGLRVLLGGMARWRVDARWYARLLIVPFLAVLLTALALVSPDFAPVALTEPNKALVAVMFVMAAFGTFVEELGWTGFATPRLRQRHGVLSTGLLLGTLWGIWHLLGVYATDKSAFGPLTPAHLLIAGDGLIPLVVFRVLMVRVYDHTHSLLLAQLMHASLTAPLFVLRLARATTPERLLYEVLFATALCVIVAVLTKREWLTPRGSPRVRPVAGAAGRS